MFNVFDESKSFMTFENLQIPLFFASDTFYFALLLIGCITVFFNERNMEQQ